MSKHKKKIEEDKKISQWLTKQLNSGPQLPKYDPPTDYGVNQRAYGFMGGNFQASKKRRKNKRRKTKKKSKQNRKKTKRRHYSARA